MFRTTKLLAILVSILVPFAAVSTAQAETVIAKTKLTPNGGKFKKKTRLPAKLSVSAVVTPQPGASLVNPTKRIDIKFPAGMTLRPNRKVCSDRKLSASSDLSTPSVVVKACRSAVVGTGTAMIYLARAAASALNDPVLIAFNAGKNKKGQPKLKIYGYSKQTQVGVLMSATLKGRSLSISIPVLSYDSAVGTFKLQIPGPRLNRPEIGVNTKGQNRRYVLASCPTPKLVTAATFFLGTRNPSTGDPTSPTTKVSSKKTVQKCVARGR